MQRKNIRIVTAVGLAVLLIATIVSVIVTVPRPADIALDTGPSPTPRIDVQLAITDVGPVEVRAGDVVGWRNEGRQPAIISCEHCAFSSGLLVPGQVYTYQFLITGTFVITADSHRQQIEVN